MAFPIDSFIYLSKKKPSNWSRIYPPNLYINKHFLYKTKFIIKKTKEAKIMNYKISNLPNTNLKIT